jgi:hypothetical protein
MQLLKLEGVKLYEPTSVQIPTQPLTDTDVMLVVAKVLVAIHMLYLRL